MGAYRLSRDALRDVAEIISYLHREISPSTADTTEARLFTAFRDLSERRAIGHRRPAITDKNVLFYNAHPYAIVFRLRKESIFVARVIHGSRDLKSLL